MGITTKEEALKLTVAKLREELNARGLSHDGLKVRSPPCVGLACPPSFARVDVLALLLCLPALFRLLSCFVAFSCAPATGCLAVETGVVIGGWQRGPSRDERQLDSIQATPMLCGVPLVVVDLCARAVSADLHSRTTKHRCSCRHSCEEVGSRLLSA